MKKKKLILGLLILAFGVTAAAHVIYDVGFKAPAINGTSNATLPETGAIILDTSSSTFYGNTGTQASPNWAALGGSPVLNYWSGYTANTSEWSTSSSTLTDGSNSGGNTLTTRQSGGITVSAAASNLAGITFTPASSSAVYMVTASFYIQTSGSGATGTYSLTDGTSVIQQGSSYTGNLGQVTVSGIYAPGTSSAITVKIQLAASAGGSIAIEMPGTGFIAPMIEWTLVQIK